MKGPIDRTNERGKKDNLWYGFVFTTGEDQASDAKEIRTQIRAEPTNIFFDS